MTAEELKQLAEIFPKAKFEAIDGIWIFDKSGTFIGAYLNNGFSLSLSYPNIEKIKERIGKFGYKCWWHEIYEQAEHDKLMDSLTE